MMETTWKKEDSKVSLPTPTWALYSEAVNKFRGSAEAFMAHVHLLNEARIAYQEAMSTSTELRNRLDAGDEALRSVMTQLEQVVNDHVSGVPDRKRPELVKSDPIRGKFEGTGTGPTFP